METVMDLVEMMERPVCVVPPVETQSGQILRALQSGEKLTPLDALEKYRCLSLSQRVGELVRMGWPIVRSTTKTPSGKVVGCYWMEAH